jgi:hypothetical protein
VAARKANGQFAKGHSGNPGGRAKNDYSERRIRQMQRLVTAADWEKIVLTAVARAKAGESTARQWISDYLLGKPIQRTEIGNLGDSPFTIALTEVVVEMPDESLDTDE